MSDAAPHIKLSPSWKALLLAEFQTDYMVDLRAFLAREKAQGRTLYPAANQWFAALNHTPFEQVRVVVIGQDPYSQPQQAHGLCFSVRSGVRVPPSLQNILREISSDLRAAGSLPAETEAVPGGGRGDLTAWAQQGVLLLNSVLTVEQGKPGSHHNRGWERFTSQIVSLLARQKEHLVFMLWGRQAQHKGAAIDASRHLVLTAPHPSPLSAHRGFFGCRHFSKCNVYLAEHGQPKIDWLRLR